MSSSSPQSQGRGRRYVEVVVLGMMSSIATVLLELLAGAVGRGLETGNAPVLSALALLVSVPLLAWMMSVVLARMGIADSIAKRQTVAALWLLFMAPLLIVLQTITENENRLLIQPWFLIGLYYASFGIALRLTRVPTRPWVEKLPLLRPRVGRPRGSRTETTSSPGPHP
jgi:hypothetical protein